MNISFPITLKGGGLKAELLRDGAGSVGLKIANVTLGLALAVVLARSLGPKGYGVYTYAFALVSVLAIPAQFGLPALVVRETAKAEANEQWGVMRGLWRWAGVSAAALALLLALIGGGLAWFFADHFSAPQLAAFGWGLALVPLIALGSLRGAALRGLRKVVQGQLPEQLIRPALLVLLILGVRVFAEADIKADQAMALHALAAAIAFASGAWLLRRARPSGVAARPKPIYEPRRWFGSVLPFALIAGVFLINNQTDIIMLGFFTTARDVGVYRVAAQGATLVSLGFMAIGMVVMPHFARSYSSGDTIRVQRLAAAGTSAGLLLALPVLALYVAFGGFILGTVFGADYVTGYPALIILSVAQLLNVGFGMAGRLLDMSDNERETAKGVAVGAGSNIALNAALIPLYGMIGAALATGVSLITWNVLLWKRVRYFFGIDTSVVGILQKRVSAHARAKRVREAQK